MAAEAFRLGASGYLLKSSAGAELVSAIRSVVRGGTYITPRMTEDVIGSSINHFKNLKSSNHLTLRQKEVLQLLAEGRSMKEAAFILNVSPRTVAFHKYTMMEHLHIKNTAELVQYALNSHLVAAA
jgi:DNA-binding NarL/FixJ family response regulator